MKIEFKNRTRYILFGLGFLFILFLIWYFSTIITYILISVVLAFTGKPLVHFLTSLKYKRFHIPRGIAAFITLLVIWFVFFTFLRFMIPLILSELETFSQINFGQVINTIGDPVIRLMQRFNNRPISFEDQSFLEILAERLGGEVDLSKLTNVFTVIAGILGEFLIGFFSVSFITFFFLKDDHLFRDGILLLVPTDLEIRVAHILSSITRLLRRYFIGLLFDILMVGTLITLGLTLVGLAFNHAIIIGLVCGSFNIVPYLGPWMSSLLGLLIVTSLNIDADFTAQTLPLLGLMTIVFGTVHLIDNILFQPMIYSSSVKAHPLEIFLVFLAAGSIAGVLGMFLAIPVYTILRVIAKEFFDNLKIVKKLTENLEA
jgi:predicted PurR-regulated permease PerM